MAAKKIMVVIDNQQKADDVIHYVAKLATRLSAPIHLLGIMSTTGTGEFVDPVMWNVARSEFEAIMNAFVKQLQDMQLDAEVKIIKSPQIEDLCCQKTGLECQMIVVQINQENLAPRVQQILKHTTVPILLLRSNTDVQNIKNILVPLDGSQRAESCLNLAATLAQANDGHLHLVHVIQKIEITSHAPFSTDDIALEQQRIERSMYEAERYLDQISARVGVETTNHVLVEKTLTRSIHHLIGQQAIDLLILSAHGHSGEAKWPAGSIAENLIRYAEIPTLVVQDLPAAINQVGLNIARIPNGATL